MTLSAALTSPLNKIADLDDENWGKWNKLFMMFFRGCSATWITAATATSKVPDDKKELDSELVWAIYSHVSETYQPLIEDATSGLEAWRTLKTRFEKSTMSRRIKALISRETKYT
ncbi:hypothetical protein DFH07DRAFT_948228 [Mycena maculata]|uniref:Uncharacterized protein n=1 Tax=Mycena maculata TaxID=230809 RepID=A0AAD7P2L0_9AGAR|nr:hypothetical protein DFH07DRAFT_948228 [Mycena maculata]